MNITDKLNELTTSFPKKYQEYMHLGSFSNFLYHLDNIPSVEIRNKIREQIENYFLEIERRNYIINRKESTLLGKEFVWEIGKYYKMYLGFKIHMTLFFALFIGAHFDILFLLFGFLEQFYYLPISTICFLCYYLFSHFTYEKKRKVYGIRY